VGSWRFISLDGSGDLKIKLGRFSSASKWNCQNRVKFSAFRSYAILKFNLVDELEWMSKEEMSGYVRITFGLVVATFVFLICMVSAHDLFQHQVFNQENIIFDADPYYRSLAFAEGWGERSLMHPNLSNYINPFVRVAERVLRPLVQGVAPSELRMRLSLGISPLFAALTTLLVFYIATLNQVSVSKAFALAGLFGLSMSTVAFGSVPDHFLISAFLCALGVLLFHVDSGFTTRMRFILWVLLITATAGITISNAMPLLALFGVSERMKQSAWIVAVRRVLFASLVTALLTLSSWAALNWWYGDFSSIHADQAYKRNVGRVMFYITDDPLRDFVSFPITLGRAFWAGKPDLDKNPPYPNPEIAKYNIAFGYPPPLKQPLRNSLLQLMPGAMIVVSLLLGLRQRSPELLTIMLPVMVFLFFNWVLHSVWGGGAEIFLFSPHWHFASVLALIPLARLCSSRVWSPIFLSAAMIVAVLNLLIWYDALILLPTLALS
jgi:hypothetical protein